jgi:glycosyltransferase involved in cell wall biosynthesis
VRILVLSNLFPPAVYGGYEIECATVVEHLRKQHQVLVLTSRKGRQRGAAEPGVSRVLPFLPYRKVVQMMSPLNAIRAAVSTRRALRAFEPEVVYVWNGSMIPQVTIRLLETSGAKVLFRICEHWFGTLYDSDEFMGGLRGGRWQRTMRTFNRLPALRVEAREPVDAAISWNSETLRRLTPMPDTVRARLERATLPATAHGEAFVGVERRPSAEPTVAFVGRVAAYKGADVAVRAIAELRRRQGLEVRLIVAGAGEADFLRELEQLAGELGVGDLLELRGGLETAELRDLLARVHALLAPSVWEEPAGLVVVEAALARVPVVASRVGGIPEFLRDGEDALLCPPGDPVALAQAVADTLGDGAATQERVERAFEHVQQFRLDHYLKSMDLFLADGLEALST